MNKVISEGAWKSIEIRPPLETPLEIKTGLDAIVTNEATFDGVDFVTIRYHYKIPFKAISIWRVL
jgi:hypothetical protein